MVDSIPRRDATTSPAAQPRPRSTRATPSTATPPSRQGGRPRPEEATPSPTGGRAPSVKDVARLAGVSVGTVSNVVNQRGTVRADIRERVAHAISELGYVPNPTAQALRRGVSPVVGVAVLDLRNPFFMEAAAGMERRLSADGCVMSLSATHSDPETESRLLRTLAGQSPRGILLAPSDADLVTAHELVARGIPVVLFDCPETPDDMSSICVDDRAGARLAISHLLDLGHRRITMLNGPSTVRQARHRQSGVMEAVEAFTTHSQDPIDLRVCEVEDFTAEAGREQTQQMLADAGVEVHRGTSGVGKRTGPLAPPVLPDSFPTALFCANDLIAFGAMTALRDSGVRIPEDVSLVGFDDTPVASQMSVPLTTVNQPMDELGWAAAELLLGGGPNARIRHERFFPNLVVRASTGAPRGK
ncbi:LacI family DNA-binding transcriptional regulator [Schaalia sp. 19OD2882]|uniref:LacI family DNA-binding transcriptional regulator n=1 Tax=Schaalia sp. 19OD2882 TaxID=2794089 RepID=UPI001C1F069D|nr:LacI family DNA-binding transcriptional regulator [Schaalia sp. 19OD2882]QWW19473.1 LacI family DNA-binding transcriptional regulator [Schaalia sp. 19OD2882]